MSGVTEFLGGRVRLFAGDCREGVAALSDNSIDAICTDPPYALDSIRKRFGGADAAPAQHGRDGAYARASRGFMGKEWDTGEVAFDPAFWAECLRVLKPGGHVLAFSGTRTYHNMATAIEQAGFEISDMVTELLESCGFARAFVDSLSEEQTRLFVRALEESEFGGMLGWVFGTGFPKNHDVAKGIDRHLGAERKVVGRETIRNDMRNGAILPVVKNGKWAAFERDVTEAGSTEARAWEGWGTALKPAMEPICLARKPLEGSVAANVLKWGTGALHVDACRVGDGELRKSMEVGLGRKASPVFGSADAGSTEKFDTDLGRWPANVIHDGSAEVESAFPSVGPTKQRKGKRSGKETGRYGEFSGQSDVVMGHDSPAGSAARFFYSAKADGNDRVASQHPTVKPGELMRYLVRLITPPGGVVLDPFAGTGTTGEAAYHEGFSAFLCEREDEYQADIARRMELALAGPAWRKRAIIQRKIENGTLEAAPLGGLFGGDL